MHLALLLLAALLLGCPSEPLPEPEPTPEPPAPVCGDGTTDADEGCDDGNGFGGDGCSPTCRLETLPGEVEPNDTPETATSLPAGGALIGGLPARDVDCVAVELLDGGWIAADLTGEDGQCIGEAALSLHDPSGALIATGTPGEEGGCAPLDPRRDEGARFTAAGTWAVCVHGFLDAVAPTWTLGVTTGDDACALDAIPFSADDDPDADGLQNVCDADDDGDGIDDLVDLCPEVPDGGLDSPLWVDDDGYIRQWLLAGPIPDLPSDTPCMPSPEEVLGDDAAAEPALGDAAGSAVFTPYFSRSRRIDFLRTMGGPTPREVYAAAWVFSAGARDVTLALGADDGVRVWLNGAQVIEIGSCQGVNNDQFTAEVALLAGWNRLLLEIRDQGGGWGMMVRFKDGDDPVTDLEVSLMADQTWAPAQTDLDGDGLGDWCDDTPNGG